MLSKVAGISAAMSSGQCHKTSWTKTAGAAVAAGYWYNTFLMTGQPPVGTYGSPMTANQMYGSTSASATVLTNSSVNWTVAVTTNVVTIDTITAHHYIANQIVTTNTGTTAWSTNTFMKGITFTIASIPTGHTFTFSLTQDNQGPIVEAGILSGMGPTYNPTTGRISCAENVMPLIKHLANIEVVTPTASAAPCWLVLADLLVNYPGIDMTSGSLQTFTASLGYNGYNLPRYVDGNGVMMFLEVTTTLTGANSPLITQLNYVNNLGTPAAIPSVYANSYVTIPTLAPAQRIAHSGTAQNNFGPFIPLAAGDAGVRSATSIMLSATATAGVAALILCRPLATIPLISSAAGNVVATTRDYIFNMPTFPRIYDGACLAFLLCAGGAATPTLYGTLDFVWG